MRTTTIKAKLTAAEAKALAALGLSGEERGGDATRSTFRNASVRHTGHVVIVSRCDGGDLTAADIASARKALCSTK